MIDDIWDDDPLAQENERLKQELRILGRDPDVFDGLLPDELNLRLQKAVEFAEEVREAELLGHEPPPSFLDPLSPDWMPDIDDMVHREAEELLGADFPLVPDSEMSDEVLIRRLHDALDRLAEKGIGFGIIESVPERIAYRYLMEELSEGMDIMPGWVVDGCSGDCEGCFQLPYCETGKQLAEEYHFDVPDPPLPARKQADWSSPGQSSKPYMRMPTFGPPSDGADGDTDFDFGEDIPF